MTTSSCATRGARPWLQHSFTHAASLPVGHPLMVQLVRDLDTICQIEHTTPYLGTLSSLVCDLGITNGGVYTAACSRPSVRTPAEVSPPCQASRT